MEFHGSKAYWENRLKECTSFGEKVEVLEELLLFLGEELSQALGDGSNQSEDFEEGGEEKDGNLVEAFVEALEALWRREESTIRAPLSRRKVLRGERKVSIEDLSLEDLLELYTQYLAKRENGDDVLPDAEFERLLEERRERILSLCREDVFFPLGRFFEDCKSKREIIATFLVLLDLVFRNILNLRRTGDGDIFIGSTGSEISSKSP